MSLTIIPIFGLSISIATRLVLVFEGGPTGVGILSFTENVLLSVSLGGLNDAAPFSMP